MFILDCIKGFGRIVFKFVFSKRLRSSLPGVKLPVLIYIYLNQQFAVKWKIVSSTTSIAPNGVRQCSVPLHIIFVLLHGRFDKYCY